MEYAVQFRFLDTEPWGWCWRDGQLWTTHSYDAACEEMYKRVTTREEGNMVTMRYRVVGRTVSTWEPM